MAPDYPTTHGTKTVERSPLGLESLLAMLATLALWAVAGLGVVMVTAVVAASGPLGALLVALAVLAAPVLLAWVGVRAVTRMV